MSANIIESPEHWQALPLTGDGRSVIEASAGTGKTYTIGMLYLRAILEERKLPRELLVTTFTRAAAAEISARVRSVLEAALEHASGRPATHEGVREWLNTRWTMEGASAADDAQRLAVAIAGFDQAAIGTLHAICQRILADHPFAVRAGFIAPSLIDSKQLNGEIARDLWRRMVSPDDDTGLRQAYVDSRLELGLDAFVKVFQRTFSDGWTLDVLDAETQAVLDAGMPDGGWTAAQIEAFLSIAHLKGRRKATTAIDAFLSHLAECEGDLCRMTWSVSFAPVIDEPWVHNDARSATDAEIEAFKAFIIPRLQWLRAKQRANVLTFWQRVFESAQMLRESRMAASHTLTFDAVLTRVRDALRAEADAGTEARPLADALHAAWPMAMVDEFQDTDGIQFEILDRIYARPDGTPRGRLVMIGDPKQSIYRFRGADVNVFVRATQVAAADKLILGKNFRSSAPYVEAVNYFYTRTKPDLGGEGQEIHYHTVEASDRCDDRPLTVGGQAAVPLTLWVEGMQENGDDDKAKTARDRPEPLSTCAHQIAALLSDPSAKIGDERLLPGDVAVLVTSNTDVYEMVNALRARGVPAVSKSTRSVFGGETAYELQVLLHAVLHAGDPSVRRAAAATSLWGASYDTVLAWSENEGLDRDMADTLNAWHAAWLQNGPLHLVAQVIAHTAPMQLTAQSGERVLTDLRHLGELIQGNTQAGDSLAAQWAWLARQIEDSDIKGDENNDEANTLRMESDEARVQVMTLHASKGLEFPLVFLPTAHKGPAPEQTPYIYTDAEGVRRLTPFDDAKSLRDEARDQERRRLLYVALTRAIHACHVYGVHSTKKASSPIAEILQDFKDVLSSDAAGAAGVMLMPHWPDSSEPARYRGTADDTRAPRARVLPPKPVGALPEHHSFTTLTRTSKQVHAHLSAPADDEQDAADALAGTAAGNNDIATLEGVKGAEIGNALHAVMEHRDFALPLASQLALITQQLDAFGIPRGTDKSALPVAVAAMLDRALSAPLQLASDGDFSLSRLAPQDTRAELEFHFEISDFNLGQLRKVLADHGLGMILPERSFEVHGLLNGKIDLVFDAGGCFHVLDYKSNSAGSSDADYSGDALVAYMDKSYYRFQALIYVVALDRYLSTRLDTYQRSAHLGEAVYLFLRAARPGSTAGVWSYRFEDDVIEAVQQVLTGRHA